MALDQTQPKSGHLHGTSTNDTKRTGRSSGLEQVQDGRNGYPWKKDANEGGRPGATDKYDDVTRRGFVRNEISGQDAKRNTADGVGRPLPTP